MLSVYKRSTLHVCPASREKMFECEQNVCGTIERVYSRIYGFQTDILTARCVGKIILQINVMELCMHPFYKSSTQATYIIG